MKSNLPVKAQPIQPLLTSDALSDAEREDILGALQKEDLDYIESGLKQIGKNQAALATNEKTIRILTDELRRTPEFIALQQHRRDQKMLIGITQDLTQRVAGVAEKALKKVKREGKLHRKMHLLLDTIINSNGGGVK